MKASVLRLGFSSVKPGQLGSCVWNNLRGRFCDFTDWIWEKRLFSNSAFFYMIN